jgi:malate synthase
VITIIHQDPQLEHIHFTGTIIPEFAEILTPEAINFVATLARAFSERRESLLHMRVRRQAEIYAGKIPDFLPETKHIRTSDWTISPEPADLNVRDAINRYYRIPQSGGQALNTQRGNRDAIGTPSRLASCGKACFD